MNTYDRYKKRYMIFEDDVNKVYIDDDGEFHRDENEGPALITDNSKYYYTHGRLHRTRGPAIVTPTSKVWCVDGEISRVEGPAIISKSHGFNGFWVVNGYIVGDDLKDWFKEHNMDYTKKMSDEERYILHLTWDKYKGDLYDYVSVDELFIY